MMLETPFIDRLVNKAKNASDLTKACALALATGVVLWTFNLNPFAPSHSSGSEAAALKRVDFKEEFTLGERESYVSNHGVIVATKYIIYNEGEEPSAELGVSVKGPVDDMNPITKGSVIELSRADCDSLKVIVTDVQFTWPSEVTLDQIRNAGTGVRKVHGTIVGKCEE